MADPYSTGRWRGHDTRTLTFAAVLAERAARIGERVCIEFPESGRHYTYADVDRLSTHIACALQARGIGPGSNVALMMDNTPDHILMIFALAKLGATSVLINTAAVGDLLQHFLTLSDASALVIEGVYLSRWLAVRAATPRVVQVVIHGDSQPTEALDAGLQSTAFGALLESESPSTLPVTRFSDPAHIMFTSGTTGPSKGVLYTQARSLMYALDAVSYFGLGASDKVYCWMPLTHLSGLQCAVLATVMAEGSLTLVRRFSASRFLHEVNACEATVIMMPGASLNMLWGKAASTDDRRHKVRLCSTVPPPPFATEFEARFGMCLVSAYGLTDCGMPTAFTVLDPASNVGAPGRAADGWEVKIFDAEEFEVPPRTVGEIVVR